MPYCTVSLKLLSPTEHKKRQLEDAMDRYASAFERLLRCVRPKIEGHICSKAEIARQINLYMPQVDQLGVQPFKDALKRDVAKTLYLYTVQKQKGSGKRYPMLQSNDEDLTQLLMRKEPIAPRTLDYWLERYHRQRPLLFCRYSETRNYALLYDEILLSAVSAGDRRLAKTASAVAAKWNGFCQKCRVGAARWQILLTCKAVDCAEAGTIR